eukprot:6970086-Ditylum_brightwellii.AAC.1
MELDGRIDACFSIDSDCVILGLTHVIFKVNWVEETFQSYKQGDVLDQPGKYPLAKYPVAHWPMLACLLGNDYVSNIPNVGGKTVLILGDIMNELNEWSVERLEHILSHPAAYKNDNIGLGAVTKKLRSQYTVASNHWVLFGKAMRLFQHCPVLDVQGKLVPLNPLPTFLNEPLQQWDEHYIGFNPYSPLGVKQEDYMRAS